MQNFSLEAVTFSQAMTCNYHMAFTNEKRRKHISSSTFNLEYYIYIVITEKRNQKQNLATLRWEGFLVYVGPQEQNHKQLTRAHSLLSKINMLNICIPASWEKKNSAEKSWKGSVTVRCIVWYKLIRTCLVVLHFCF